MHCLKIINIGVIITAVRFENRASDKKTTIKIQGTLANMLVNIFPYECWDFVWYTFGQHECVGKNIKVNHKKNQKIYIYDKYSGK